MILDAAPLLPSSYLPLYIFEPRYRRMLAHALESERLFAVASRGSKQAGAHREIGGLGIFGACVSNSDGTSNLILQGLARVKFTAWSKRDGYPLADISILESEALDSPENSALQKEILGLMRRAANQIPDHLFAMLAEAPDSSIFSDLAAAAIVAEPALRQRLLEETHVGRRLEILAAYLASSPACAG